MESLHRPIVLIGFKHTGKSVVGKCLAKKFNIPFTDLDEKMEAVYESDFNEKLTCRQIMQKKGEAFFRFLEMTALSDAVDFKPSVISLGGGAPLSIENQNSIKSCIVVHVTAPKDIVFERIRSTGQPAFFNSEEDLLESFNRMWDDRQQIYEKIKHFSIVNDGTVDEAVLRLIEKLERFTHV